MYLRHFALTGLPFETPGTPPTSCSSPNSRREGRGAPSSTSSSLRGIGACSPARSASGKNQPWCRHVHLHAPSRPVPHLLRLAHHRQRARHVQVRSVGRWGCPPKRFRAPPPTAPSAQKITRPRRRGQNSSPSSSSMKPSTLRNDRPRRPQIVCANFMMDSEKPPVPGARRAHRACAGALAMAVHESLSQRLVVRHHLNGLGPATNSTTTSPTVCDSPAARLPSVRATRRRGPCSRVRAGLPRLIKPHRPLRP